MTSEQDSVMWLPSMGEDSVSIQFNHKPSAFAVAGEAGFHTLWRMQKKAKGKLKTMLSLIPTIHFAPKFLIRTILEKKNDCLVCIMTEGEKALPRCVCVSQSSWSITLTPYICLFHATGWESEYHCTPSRPSDGGSRGSSALKST